MIRLFILDLLRHGDMYIGSKISFWSQVWLYGENDISRNGILHIYMYQKTGDPEMESGRRVGNKDA